MSKYLSLLLAASITSVMAADDKPEGRPHSKKIERKAYDRELSSKESAQVAIANVEKEKAEKIAFISQVFPGINTTAMDDKTIEQYTVIANRLKAALTSYSEDPEMLELGKTTYINTNKMSPIILYADQIATLVNASIEKRQADSGRSDGETLQAIPMWAHNDKVQYYAGRVTDVGLSRTTLQLLSAEKDNIIAYREDCHTIQDFATEGCPVEGFIYHIYKIPAKILKLMQMFPSIFEPNFKLFITKNLGESANEPLNPLRYPEAHDIITLRIETDKAISSLEEGGSTLDPTVVEKYLELYNDPDIDPGLMHLLTKVPLNLRWYDEQKPTSKRVESQTTQANKVALGEIFDANLNDGKALFGIESPKAKKKSKKPRSSSSAAAPSSSSADKEDKLAKGKSSKSRKPTSVYNG